MVTLPTASTALILIDLQKGIAAYQLAPYSFEAVFAKGKELARRFRVAKAPVVLVNVAFAPDFSDALKAPVERPMQAPPGGFLEDWSELADGLAEASDLKVTKRQWGAFYGTDLDRTPSPSSISSRISAGWRRPTRSSFEGWPSTT
jgi:nicotinamidase-related amidase